MVEYRKITVQSVSFNCFSKPFDWMQKFTTSIDGYHHLFPELTRVSKDEKDGGTEYYFLWSKKDGGLISKTFKTIAASKDFVKNNCYIATHGDGSSGLRIIHPDNMPEQYSDVIDGLFSVDMPGLLDDCYSAKPQLVA